MIILVHSIRPVSSISHMFYILVMCGIFLVLFRAIQFQTSPHHAKQLTNRYCKCINNTLLKISHPGRRRNVFLNAIMFCPLIQLRDGYTNWVLVRLLWIASVTTFFWSKCIKIMICWDTFYVLFKELSPVVQMCTYYWGAYHLRCSRGGGYKSFVDDCAGCKRYLRTHGEIYHLFRLTMGKKIFVSVFKGFPVCTCFQ